MTIREGNSLEALRKELPNESARYAVSASGEVFFGRYANLWAVESLTRAQVAEACGCEVSQLRDSYYVGIGEVFEPQADEDSLLECICCQADDYGEWGSDWVADQLQPTWDSDAGERLREALQRALDEWLDSEHIRPTCIVVYDYWEVPFGGDAQ